MAQGRLNRGKLFTMTTLRQPLDLLDRAVMVGMRTMVASMKGSVTGPEARKPFDELMETTPAAPA
jgi:hypothetical protein